MLEEHNQMHSDSPMLGDDGELRFNSLDSLSSGESSTTNQRNFAAEVLRKFKILLVVCTAVALWQMLRFLAPFFQRETLSLLIVGGYIVWLFYTPWSTGFFGGIPSSKHQKSQRGAEDPLPKAIKRNRMLSREAFFVDSAHHPYVRGNRIRLKPYEQNNEVTLLGGTALSIFGLVMASFLPYFASLTLVTSIQLEMIGIPTQGKITGCKVDRGKETRYFITYQYLAADYPAQIFQGELERTQAVCESTVSGTPISVVYLPYDPSVSSSGVGNLFTALVLSGFMTLWGLLGAGAIKGGISTYRRSLHLRKHGILIPGTIISCTGEFKGRAGFIIDLYYVFTTPEGYEIYGKVSHLRNDLARLPLPRANDPLVILISDRNCYKVL